MKMKMINEVPTSGQFVAIWKNNGRVWSDTIRAVETTDEWGDPITKYEVYHEAANDFIPCRSFSPSPWLPDGAGTDVMFIVIEE